MRNMLPNYDRKPLTGEQGPVKIPRLPIGPGFVRDGYKTQGTKRNSVAPYEDQFIEQ
jgi:hypothetical protein